MLNLRGQICTRDLYECSQREELVYKMKHVWRRIVGVPPLGSGCEYFLCVLLHQDKIHIEVTADDTGIC